MEANGCFGTVVICEITGEANQVEAECVAVASLFIWSTLHSGVKSSANTTVFLDSNYRHSPCSDPRTVFLWHDIFMQFLSELWAIPRGTLTQMIEETLRSLTKPIPTELYSEGTGLGREWDIYLLKAKELTYWLCQSHYSGSGGWLDTTKSFAICFL